MQLLLIVGGIISIVLLGIMIYITPSYGNIPAQPNSFISILLMFIFIPILCALVFAGDKHISDKYISIAPTKTKDMTPFLLIVGLLFSLVLFILLVCLAVHPTEGFASNLENLEARTCVLMAKADAFIESRIRSKVTEGPKDAEGNLIYTPELQKEVKEAQQKARGSNIVMCGSAPTPDVVSILKTCTKLPCISPDPTEAERIEAIRATLQTFIGPVFIPAFNELVNSSMTVDVAKGCPPTLIPCYDVNTITQKQILEDSKGIHTIDKDSLLWKDSKDLLAVIECYEKKILGPMDIMVERLKKGQLSDCERKILIPS